MNVKVNKNLLLPILIIVVALLIGGNLLLSDALFSNNKSQTPSDVNQNLRTLIVSVPGIVCAGCAASIENYVKAMPGVVNASVSLTAKSGVFVYELSKVSKEEIVKNTIFDIYPPTIVSDEPYDPATGQITQFQTSSLPLTIQKKSNQVSQLLSQKQKDGVNTQKAQNQLYEVNNLLSSGKYQEAEQLLDIIIRELKQS